MKRVERKNLFISWIIVILTMIVVIFPIYWLILTAFKQEWAIFHDPPIFFPLANTLENIKNTLFGTNNILPAYKFILNSFIIAFTNTLLVVIVSFFAAYSIARFKTGGNNFATWILSNRYLPPIVFVLPLFIIFRFLKLTDTYIGLILVYCLFNIPFAVWFLISFIRDAPVELEEAAQVDGCSRTGAMFRILVPIILPGLAVTTLFTFIFAWNEYLFALQLAGNKVVTLPVYLPRLRGAHDVLYGQMSSAALIAIIPAIILAFLLQRYLVRGLTLGALKQ